MPGKPEGTPRARPDVTEPEIIGGIEKRTIRLAEYDASWPDRYVTERGRITEALGAKVLLVEHIGSTSVPGLSAKAIIDILVTVPDITDEGAYVQPLLDAGYELRVREPRHRMVRTPERDVHVHILEPEDPAAADYLLLRDQLRRDTKDRDRYALAKHELARQDWSDMNAYAEAKTEIIEEIKARARAARNFPE